MKYVFAKLWIFIYLFLLVILEKYGILKMQTLNVSKTQYQILTGKELSVIKIATKNVKIYQKPC